MGEGLKTNNIELQEMARIILCEIYGTKRAKSKLGDFASLEEERLEDFRFENGINKVERRSAAFGDISGFPRQSGEKLQDGEFFPRLSRKEFLEQRAERRRPRGNPLFSLGGASSAADGKSIKLSDNLTQADLSEKLSDIFCRDARRYDGAYERY